MLQNCIIWIQYLYLLQTANVKEQLATWIIEYSTLYEWFRFYCLRFVNICINSLILLMIAFLYIFTYYSNLVMLISTKYFSIWRSIWRWYRFGSNVLELDIHFLYIIWWRKEPSTEYRKPELRKDYIWFKKTIKIR